jgi:ribosome-associated protein
MEKKAVQLTEFLDSKKAKDIVLLDIRGKSSLADYFIIATGLNKRHTAALADDLEKKAYELGLSVRSKEGHQSGEWILIDFNDVIVHLFTDETRSYYSLERLWHHAKKVELDIDTTI